jgi:uncharacterized membrane protein
LADHRRFVYSPFSPIITIFVILVAILLVAFVFLGLIGAAFGRIGFSAQVIAFLLIAVLVGSFIYVPLFTLESQSRVVRDTYVSIFGMTYRVPSAAEGSRKTVVAINVGGALIPSIVSLYLLWRSPDIAGVAIVGVTLVAIVSHLTSRPVVGVGVVSPALVSPLVAAIYTVLVLTQVPTIENGFAVAYISGVLGTLIGADITNLGAIKKIGAPVASIGGAGTFDGVFLSGIIAVLLT